MKYSFAKRALALLLALVCVMGVLPLSAFAAAGLSSAPGSITQRSSDYMKIGGKSVRYKAASSVINNVGLPYVFDEQVDVPGFGPTRALCAYQRGTLGPAANGQKWTYKEEVTHPSLKVLLTYIYSHTYNNFTDTGNNRKTVWIDAEKDQDVVVDFVNSTLPGVRLLKLDQQTNKPIPGATFKIEEVDGGFTDQRQTDKDGVIFWENLRPGAYKVYEVTPAPNYVHDDTVHVVQLEPNHTTTIELTNIIKQAPELVFWNERAGTLVIRKLDSVTKKPLAGVQFELTHPDGRYVDADNGHLSSKGIFQTDQNGEIRVSVTGTVVVKEIKTLPGYSIDPAGQIQTVEVNPDDTQYLVFYNAPAGNFELIKVVAGNKEKRIPNVTFEIRRADDDALIDTITTDSEGRATLQLEAGNYYAVETECPKEYRLDSTHHTFNMKDGKNTTLTVENKAFSGILIHKTDSVTGKGIYGVSFLLYDSTNKPIGQYTSDNSGYVYIEDLADGGRYYLRELENEGYIPDTQMKTVYVKAGETTLIEWKNTPIDGRTYEGTGEAIMDQLRLSAFDPTEHPDAQSYLQQLRANFIRTTGLDCPLPEGSVERQAQAVIEQLARYGALEVVHNG